jgi:hypothetical protein
MPSLLHRGQLGPGLGKRSNGLDRCELDDTNIEEHTCEAGIWVVAVVPAGEVDS